MKRYVLALAVISTPAFGQTQTTTCNTIGSTVTCTTPQTDPQPDVGQRFLENMQRQQREQLQQQSVEAEASANRRAAAYGQVGALIAKGDCESAKRLASFYGRKDIVKDTARACSPQ